MREKLEAKINEVLEAIISKDAKDITYNEYRILDNKLAMLKYDEDAKRRQEELTSLMIKSVNGCCSMPTALPESTKED